MHTPSSIFTMVKLIWIQLRLRPGSNNIIMVPCMHYNYLLYILSWLFLMIFGPQSRQKQVFWAKHILVLELSLKPSNIVTDRRENCVMPAVFEGIRSSYVHFCRRSIQRYKAAGLDLLRIPMWFNLEYSSLRFLSNFVFKKLLRIIYYYFFIIK